jgi:methionyl-tRNA formyltransferase
MHPQQTLIPGPARRLVAITSGHAFGERLLRRLEQAGIRLDMLLVTVQQNTPRGPIDMTLSARSARARARLRARWRAWRRFRAVTRRIAAFDSLADPAFGSTLVRARPDVLILAGTGIVPAPLLAVPAMTLNAHPGLLPWVRGVCPLEHALLRGIAPGVTVHAVDPGIDTGPIIRRVLLPVSDGEHDRIALSRRLEDMAIDALVDVVRSLVASGAAVSPRPQRSRHPYGGWVSDAERASAQKLLDRGEAALLYQRWRAAAGGDVLPDDDALLPVPSR